MDDQRRTRSLSQLNMPPGGGGRRSVLGSMLSGDGTVDTEKEIQAASERRRTTAKYALVSLPLLFLNTLCYIHLFNCSNFQ